MHDPAHATPGSALVSELTLPVTMMIPVSGRVCVPVVKVVAETVMCQPAPVPELSSTVSC